MGQAVTIDLKKLQGKFLSGRERGREIRNIEGVDRFDESDVDVNVIFPDTVRIVSSSFFLGMFGKSIVKFATKEDFKKKYNFFGNKDAISSFDSYIDFALQNKNLL